MADNASSAKCAPCRFCGSHDLKVNKVMYGDCTCGPEIHYVICLECHAQGPQAPNALRAWAKWQWRK
jgi:ribosomal protein L40E